MSCPVAENVAGQTQKSKRSLILPQRAIRALETVYRHVIVPQIRGGATIMDSVFGPEDDESA